MLASHPDPSTGGGLPSGESPLPGSAAIPDVAVGDQMYGLATKRGCHRFVDVDLAVLRPELAVWQARVAAKTKEDRG